MDGIYEKIRVAVGKAVDAGAHINAANAAEGIGKSMGLSNNLMQFTHVELRNAVYEADFKKVPYKDRAIFLPHCSRNTTNCKATFDEEGYHCKRCGCCDIDKVTDLAKEIGYGNVFIVPGGSLVKKLIDKYKPKAALGVCCFNEAILSFEAMKYTNVVPQIALLLKDGCKDTQMNIQLIEEKMRLIDPKLAKKEERKKKKLETK
jgi:hypothetical protein